MVERLLYRSVVEGQPIILCERFRSTLDTWDPAFVDGLTSSFQVVTYTYGDFGRSSGEPHADVQTTAQEVKASAAALGLKTSVLGGWPFAGMVAPTVFTEYPELVSHLVLIGTTPRGSVTHRSEEVFFERALKPMTDLTDEEMLFFEPASELNHRTAIFSHERISARQDDVEAPMTKREREFLFPAGAPFKEDKYHTLDKLKAGTQPAVIFSGGQGSGDLFNPLKASGQPIYENGSRRS